MLSTIRNRLILGFGCMLLLLGLVAGVGPMQLAAGEAVRNMGNATRQNAALVEQMAAAASSLEGQANELVKSADVFKLTGSRNHANR